MYEKCFINKVSLPCLNSNVILHLFLSPADCKNDKGHCISNQYSTFSNILAIPAPPQKNEPPIKRQHTVIGRVIIKGGVQALVLPWPGRAAAGPGARPRADTPRGPPPLTALNQTACWCRNPPSPATEHRQHEVSTTTLTQSYRATEL